MEHTKELVTWKGVTSLCNKIVKKLKLTYPDILDYKIVGLSRGGLIPATIISNILNIRKVYSIGLKSYEDTMQGDLEIYQIPELKDMEKILIIDDISDTGESLKATKEMIQNKDVITTCLHIKEKSIFLPDIYGKSVENNVWVVYPWESL